MKNLIPYIVFPGTCLEAMKFYATALNGEITTIQTFRDSPIKVSEESQERIFDSELKAGNIHFKASDDLPDHSVRIGTNVSLFISFSDKITKADVFKKLSEDGKILFPLDENFGMLKDQYGIQWMFVNEQ